MNEEIQPNQPNNVDDPSAYRLQKQHPKFKQPPPDTQNFSKASHSSNELTVKAFILAIILTVILGAANAYLGLKVGITISASIPAAIISMGILRLFKHSTILENNIVQTAASAGETLTAAIAFTIPSLLIIKSWTDFNYTETTLIAMIGGILGVLFAIPLRRVLLFENTLRFPEGTAIGKILRAKVDGGTVLKDLIWGSLVGGGIGLAQIGLKIISASTLKCFNVAGTVIGIGAGFSPALIAAGYIIGPEVGVSLLVGIVLAWLIGIPILGLHFGINHSISAVDSAMQLWSQHIRYIGIGTMLIGGIWTVLLLIKPMALGIQASYNSVKLIAEHGKEIIPRTKRDIPITYVMWCALFLTIPMFMLYNHFTLQLLQSLSTVLHISIVVMCLLFAFIMGFLCAAICAYLAGLVGSSASPISGIALISILAASFLLLSILNIDFHALSTAQQKLGAASLAVMMTSVVICASSISNDTMQDLKAGYMVGATPWKQQLMLIVGVIVSALTIPLVLKLLFNAYGIGGVYPHAGMDPTQTLAAPQANLIATVALAVVSHQVQWNMLLLGCAIAVLTIVIDLLIQHKQLRLHVLAVGVGLYLPLEASTPLVLGGITAYISARRLKLLSTSHQVDNHSTHLRQQRGLLLACGLVAGAALIGVILAIPFALAGSSDVLKIVSDRFIPVADGLGLIASLLICVWLYRVVAKR